MDNSSMQLKFTARQLAANSKRAVREEKKEKAKLKKAIEQGNTEGARIYAQNAIRQKNQALNYLRLSSRVEAVASRVESASRMKTVTYSMANIVQAMDRSMKEMNLEKMTQIMDQFEQQFEDMDVQADYVEQAMNQTTAMATPQGQVDELIQQVAAEHGLELTEELGKIPVQKAPVVVQRDAAEEQDELTARLTKLKQF